MCSRLAWLRRSCILTLGDDDEVIDCEGTSIDGGRPRGLGDLECDVAFMPPPPTLLLRVDDMDLFCWMVANCCSNCFSRSLASCFAAGDGILLLDMRSEEG